MSLFANMIIVAVLATLRITGEKSEAFQAIAHLYVGGLFAWSVCEYRFVKTKALDVALRPIALFIMAVVVSLIELVVAIVQRL